MPPFSPRGIQAGGGPTAPTYRDPRATQNSYTAPAPTYREGLTKSPSRDGSGGGGGGTYDTPIPGMDIYGGAAAAASAAYQAALARLNQQRGNLLTQFGYTGKIDPSSGMLSGLAVDIHNPYGQLQQLLGNEANDDNAAAEQAQQRGIMGGLANKAVSSLKYAHGAQSAQLGTTFQGDLNSLQSEQDAAYQRMEDTLWQAQLAQAQLAIEQGAYNPGDPGSSDSSSSGGSNSSNSSSSSSGSTKSKPKSKSTTKQTLARYLTYGHI